MWSTTYEACSGCGTTKRKHVGRGLCSRCYHREYARSINPEASRRAKRDWYRRAGGARYSKEKREERYFASRRGEVLARDGYQCAVCGSTVNLVVHHRDGKGRGHATPNNELDNLVTVCRKCHPTKHGGTRWARNYDACTECGTTERRHNARGLCCNCYVRNRNQGYCDDIVRSPGKPGESALPGTDVT